MVYAFLDGLLPESIVDSFDTLTLEDIYGAIAFYLGHRHIIDVYLKQSETQFDEFCRRAREAKRTCHRHFLGSWLMLRGINGKVCSEGAFERFHL